MKMALLSDRQTVRSRPRGHGFWGLLVGLAVAAGGWAQSLYNPLRIQGGTLPVFRVTVLETSPSLPPDRISTDPAVIAHAMTSGTLGVLERPASVQGVLDLLPPDRRLTTVTFSGTGAREYPLDQVSGWIERPVPNSEKVVVEGTPQRRFQDYVVDWPRRLLVFTTPVPAGQKITLSYYWSAQAIDSIPLIAEPEDDRSGVYRLYPAMPVSPGHPLFNADGTVASIPAGVYRLTVTASSQGYQRGVLHREDPETKILGSALFEIQQDDRKETQARNRLRARLYYEDAGGQLHPVPKGTDILLLKTINLVKQDWETQRVLFQSIGFASTGGLLGTVMGVSLLAENAKMGVITEAIEVIAGECRVVGDDGFFECPFIGGARTLADVITIPEASHFRVVASSLIYDPTVISKDEARTVPLTGAGIKLGVIPGREVLDVKGAPAYNKDGLRVPFDPSSGANVPYRNITESFVVQLVDKYSAANGFIENLYVPGEEDPRFPNKASRDILVIPYSGVTLWQEGYLTTEGSVNPFNRDAGPTAVKIRYHNHNEVFDILHALSKGYDLFKRAKKSLDPTTRQEPFLPGVLARWSPVPNPANRGFTLYDPASRRILIPHADTYDEALILQAYSSFLRHQVLGLPDPPKGEIAQAFREGWDLFYAAAALRTPHVHSRTSGDVNLQEPSNRGLDDPVAVASALWQIYNYYGDFYPRTRAAEPRVDTNPWRGLWLLAQALQLSTITPNDELSIQDFWNKIWLRGYQDSEAYTERLTPRLWSIFEALGLKPIAREAQVFPRFQWEVNRLLRTNGPVQKLYFDLEMVADQEDFALRDADPTASVPVSRVPNLAIPASQWNVPFTVDLSTILTPEEYLKLSSEVPVSTTGEGFWRVRVLDRASGKLPYSLPLLSSQAKPYFPPLAYVDPDGGTVNLPLNGGPVQPSRQPPPEVTGTLTIPPGALAERAALTVMPVSIEAPLPGYTVVGRVAYRLSPSSLPLTRPATLTLNYGQADLGGLDATALAIYRWDPDFGGWSYLGGTVDPQARTVQVSLDRLGVLALVVETAPPILTEVQDAPDPIVPGTDSTAISFRVSKPARVGVRILDGNGQVVRTLQAPKRQTQPRDTVAWDGLTDQGTPAPDGRYTYQITAVDFAGNQAVPGLGTVVVNSGATGQIHGSVVLESADRFEGVEVTVAETTLSAFTEADGSFTLPAVPSGTFDLVFSRSGWFPETLSNIPVQAGQTLQVPPVTLRNQIVSRLAATPHRFSPDGDGIDDQVTLAYDLSRNATISLQVVSVETGQVVRQLASQLDQIAGHQVFQWDGRDDRGAAAGNGVYRFELQATITGMTIPQGTVEVVSDTGMVANLWVNPQRFAAGLEGALDLTTQLSYKLTNRGLVTVTVLDAQGQVVRRLVERGERAAGLGGEIWDGLSDAGTVVPDGLYTFKVDPFYPDGTPSLSRSATVQVDTYRPVLSDLTPANGAVIRTGFPTLTAFVDRPSEIDPNSVKVKIDEYLDTAQFDPTTGRISYTPRTSLGAGQHIAIVYASSRAGTQSIPLSHAFTVELVGKDETPPEVRDLKPLNRPAPDFEQVYSQTPALEGRLFDADSGIDKDSIILTIDATTQILGVEEIIPGSSGLSWDRWHYVRAILFYNPLTGEFRYNPLTKLSNNALHFFTIEATDRAGNKVQGQTTFKVVLDTEAPTVALSPADGETVKVNPPTVTATLSDGTGAASGIDPGTLRLRIDGQAVERPWAYYDEGTQTLTYPIPTALEENAQHIVTVDVADQAGNAAAQARSIFHLRTDDQPPSIYDLTPADGTRTDQKRPAIAARLVDRGDSQIDPASIVLKLDGTAQAVQYDSRTQRVTCQPAEELALGRHLVTLDVADTSRNRAAQAISLFEVAADITPPTITEVEPAHGSITAEARPVISARLQDVGLGIDPESIVLKIDGQAVALPPGAFDPAAGRLTYRPVEPFPERTQHIAVFSVKDRGGNPAVPVTTLFAIQAFSGGALQGTITLEGREDAAGVVVAVEGTEWQATTDAVGRYTLPSVPAGTYTVVARKEGFLVGKRRQVEVRVGALATVDLRLWAGDSNGDDRINLGDWALLTAAYGSQQGAGNYTPAADFNGDGRVDDGDVALFERNFGKYR
jgi:flagellar hook assembly protein FlgD